MLQQQTFLVLSCFIGLVVGSFMSENEAGLRPMILPSSALEQYGDFNNAYLEQYKREQRSGLEKSADNHRAIAGHMLKQPLLKFDVLWRKFAGNKKRFANAPSNSFY